MSSRAVSITGSLPVVATILTCMLAWWCQQFLTNTVGTLHSLATTLQPPGRTPQLYSSPDCLLSATVITHLLVLTKLSRFAGSASHITRASTLFIQYALILSEQLDVVELFFAIYTLHIGGAVENNGNDGECERKTIYLLLGSTYVTLSCCLNTRNVKSEPFSKH